MMKWARFMFFFHKSVLTVGIDNGYRSLPECFKIQQNAKMLGFSNELEQTATGVLLTAAI